MSEAVTHRRPAGLLARFGSAVQAAFPPPPGPADPMPPPTGPHQRHQAALAVLTAARGVVQRGWVQNTWYVVEMPAGRRRPVRLVFPSRLDHRHVVQACLVGAVVHAAWRQSARPEHAYPAIDALWHTLLGGPAGPLPSPPVRLARVHDLTRWNDRRHRTKDEVLALLDRTAARVAGA